MIIGGKQFDTEHETYIMGILNVTPDSFSDGGKFIGSDEALWHVGDMIRQGADIIDVGGESTRPGYSMISDAEEIDRTAVIIERIKEEYDIPVSLDTYKSSVAEAGILAGADLINDIWGLKYDEKMAGVIAKYGVACCLMHNRKEAVYQDFLEDVLRDLRQSVLLARESGIDDKRIILDPGVGFGKDLHQNLLITNRLEYLHELGYPILLGTSRKSMIGLTLDLPTDERVVGTVATTVLAVQKGCSFVRVYDVRENQQAIRMARAILAEA
ncbi:MAG: dihydropteroate synthase [Lachnospiraceae bacterium]|nr:dihydropteroate synthase [Lachnospiraceae bacterium]